MESSENINGKCEYKKKNLRKKGKLKWNYLECSFIPNISEFISCLQICVAV